MNTETKNTPGTQNLAATAFIQNNDAQTIETFLNSESLTAISEEELQALIAMSEDLYGSGSQAGKVLEKVAAAIAQAQDENDSEDSQTSEIKSSLWEANHHLIIKQMYSYIKETGLPPSRTLLAARTGLSRPTINAHLKEFGDHPLFQDSINMFRMMTNEVLGMVYQKCANGDLRAAKVFFDLLIKHNKAAIPQESAAKKSTGKDNKPAQKVDEDEPIISLSLHDLKRLSEELIPGRKSLTAHDLRNLDQDEKDYLFHLWKSKIKTLDNDGKAAMKTKIWNTLNNEMKAELNDMLISSETPANSAPAEQAVMEQETEELSAKPVVKPVVATKQFAQTKLNRRQRRQLERDQKKLLKKQGVKIT